MCSWCYGFSRTLDQLLDGLPADVSYQRVLGGLAPDTDEIMPESMRAHIRGNWEQIERTIPGTLFNYRFWDDCLPKRSTWVSCRAVIAARLQGLPNDERMTRAIQQAYYQRSMNPSELEVLINIAAQLELDIDRFAADLVSSHVNDLFHEELALCETLDVSSFPSLRLRSRGKFISVPVDYTDAGSMLQRIEMLKG